MKIIILLISFALTLSCGSNNTKNHRQDEEIITINAKKYYKEDVIDFAYSTLSEMEQNDRKNQEIVIRLVNEFILHKLILEEALKAGIKVENSELNKILNQDNEALYSGERVSSRNIISERITIQKYLAEKITPKISVQENELRAYYNSKYDNQTSKTTYHVMQILSETQDMAEQALKTFNRNKNFSHIYKNFSIPIENSDDGDMGIIDIEDYPTVFENIKKMKENSISNVIKSEFGYHIFYLKKVIKVEKPSFESVKKQCYDELMLIKKDNEIQKYNDEVIKNAKIKISDHIDLNIDDSKLSKSRNNK